LGTRSNGAIGITFNQAAFNMPHYPERILVKLLTALEVGPNFDAERFNQVIWPWLQVAVWKVVHVRYPSWDWHDWLDDDLGLQRLFTLSKTCRRRQRKKLANAAKRQRRVAVAADSSKATKRSYVLVQGMFEDIDLARRIQQQHQHRCEQTSIGVPETQFRSERSALEMSK